MYSSISSGAVSMGRIIEFGVKLLLWQLWNFWPGFRCQGTETKARRADGEMKLQVSSECESASGSLHGWMRFQWEMEGEVEDENEVRGITGYQWCPEAYFIKVSHIVTVGYWITYNFGFISTINALKALHMWAKICEKWKPVKWILTILVHIVEY